MKNILTVIIVSVLFSSSAFGVMLNFSDGLKTENRPNGIAVGHYYQDFGLSSPNARFHYTTNDSVPFPFEDNWGIVRDFGIDSECLLFHFSSPVDFVYFSAFSQGGIERDSEYSIRSYDSENNLVNSSRYYFNDDKKFLIKSDYFMSHTPMYIEGSEISKIELFTDRKMGIDTMVFEYSKKIQVDDLTKSVPDSGTSLVLAFLSFGVLISIKRFDKINK